MCLYTYKAICVCFGRASLRRYSSVHAHSSVFKERVCPLSTKPAIEDNCKAHFIWPVLGEEEYVPRNNMQLYN